VRASSPGSTENAFDSNSSKGLCVMTPNGHAVQLRPTALTANAGTPRPPPERYHGSIGTSCWAPAAPR
jgi:hypothetical protein